MSIRFLSSLTAAATILAGCFASSPDIPAVPQPIVIEVADNGPQSQTKTPEESALAQIDASVLEGHVRFLSDDLLEGRGPASRGDELARLYLATEMQAMGLEPGGPNGQWQQPFPIVGVESTVPDTWTFRTKDGSVPLKFWDEFIAASGVQEPTAQIRDAELVFVGYGIVAPEYDWNDYKGMDLKGKVLVMLNNDPDWDPKLFEGERRLYYGRWTYKYEIAAQQGAAAAIIIHTVPSAGYPFQVVQTSWTGEQFTLPATGGPQIQVQAWTTEEAMRKLLQSAGFDLDQLVASARKRDFRPVPLGISTSLDLTNKVSRVQTANVAGLLRGSDPQLRDEVVVYTAHHDHLGIGKPDATGDAIYNGALDNASGVASVLAVARAFTSLDPPPARSVLFLFVGAEEQGLLGSKFYAANPTFHPGRIAANVNLDSTNIWGRTLDLTLIGKGKSSLDEVATKYATLQGRSLKGDQFPDRGSFYRSDQFNFAKIGVPALYFKSGTEVRDRPAGWGKARIEENERTRYHQPSDEIHDGWSFEGMVEDARLAFLAGLDIAQTRELPAWNPGDEFEAARLEALKQAGAEVDEVD